MIFLNFSPTAAASHPLRIRWVIDLVHRVGSRSVWFVVAAVGDRRYSKLIHFHRVPILDTVFDCHL
jgi:hypothetical protein